MTIPQRGPYQVTSDVNPPRYVPGYWYTIAPTTAVASVAYGANVLRAHPWLVRSRVRVAALGARVTTGVTGAIQLGIYRANAATLNPLGDALGYTGDIDVSAIQNVSGALIQGIVTLGPGLHWLCVNTNALPLLQGIPGGSPINAVHAGGATQALVSASATAAITVKSSTPIAYGSWPDANKLTNWLEVSTNITLLGQFQVAV